MKRSNQQNFAWKEVCNYSILFLRWQEEICLQMAFLDKEPRKDCKL